MNTLRELCQRGKGKIDKYDTSLSMSENENCSRPSGTHPKLGGYLKLTLGESRSKRRSHRLFCKSSKTSERWCISICLLPFDNEASRPNRAYTTYESFPRILYHPQDVNERDQYRENLEKSKNKNPPYVANPNAMGGTRMKGETSDYGVLQE